MFGEEHLFVELKQLCPEHVGEIQHQGVLWKFDVARKATPGDPTDVSNEAGWRKLRMWITDNGGLFYFSETYNQPFGRKINSLKITADVPQPPGAEADLGRAFCFQIQPPNIEDVPLPPTILATGSKEDRAAWLKQLKEFAAEDGSNPLDIFLKRGDSRIIPARLRMARSLTSSLFKESFTRSLTKVVDSDIAQYNSTLSRPLRDPASGDLATEDAKGQKIELPKDEESGGEETEPAPTPSAAADAETSRARTTKSEEDEKAQSREDFRRKAKAAGSQAFFTQKEQVALVLDWDDTIFPTSWIREDCKLDARYKLSKQKKISSQTKQAIEQVMSRLLVRLSAFLRCAAQNAQVFIVTLAKRPWVIRSSDLFIPGLKKVLDELKLNIIYAQEGIPVEMKRKYASAEFRTAKQEMEFWTLVKSMSIAREIDATYQRVGGSWKNIISFGDSDFERYGTIAAADEYMKRETEGGQIISTDGATKTGICADGRIRRLRTKTVKMLDGPTVEELIAQVALLTEWVPSIVVKDRGFDIELVNFPSDQQLMALNKQITGQDAEMSWASLAEMEDPKMVELLRHVQNAGK